MRYKLRTLLLVPVVCAAVLVCGRIPRSAWSGAKWVNLSVQVIDGVSGRPIPNAKIELIHPFDDERAPVEGRTDGGGSVVLRNRFHAGGVDYCIGGTEYVTFSPFVIRVVAQGFAEFRACLAEPSGVPYEKATDPSLNLRYPVSGPVIIALTRSKSNLQSGERAVPNEK